MLFRLLTGSHRVHGISYRKGETLESARDLTKVFPGRFELIRDDPVLTRPDIPVKKHSPHVSVEGDEKSDPSTELSPDEEGEIAVTEVDNATPSVVDKDWDDMTDVFPTAEKLGFKVYHDGEAYRIVNPKFNKVLNRRKLPKTEKAVNVILNKYVEK